MSQVFGTTSIEGPQEMPEFPGISRVFDLNESINYATATEQPQPELKAPPQPKVTMQANVDTTDEVKLLKDTVNTVLGTTMKTLEEVLKRIDGLEQKSAAPAMESAVQEPVVEPSPALSPIPDVRIGSYTNDAGDLIVFTDCIERNTAWNMNEVKKMAYEYRNKINCNNHGIEVFAGPFLVMSGDNPASLYSPDELRLLGITNVYRAEFKLTASI